MASVTGAADPVVVGVGVEAWLGGAGEVMVNFRGNVMHREVVVVQC